MATPPRAERLHYAWVVLAATAFVLLTSGGVRAAIGVFVKPLILWLWIGGGLMALGTLLAAWPGRRRRPTQPASEPAGSDDVVPPVPVGVA